MKLALLWLQCNLKWTQSPFCANALYLAFSMLHCCAFFMTVGGGLNLPVVALPMRAGSRWLLDACQQDVIPMPKHASS